MALQQLDRRNSSKAFCSEQETAAIDHLLEREHFTPKPSHVRNDEVAAHTGLRPVMESIRRRREAIFGHVARMSPNIPAHQALRLQVETSLGRRPDRDWVRSSGRPRNRWIDQLRQDHQRPSADLWRAAIQRGHTGATLRSSTTTR